MKSRFHVLARVGLLLACAGGAWPVAANAPSILAFPPIDAERLIERDLALEGERRAGPFRFAEPIEMLARPETDGTWTTLPDGSRAWQMIVHVPGATDLNLGFRRFDIPEGARLTLADDTGQFVVGPYAKGDGAAGELWTAVVPGERLLIELQVPADAPEPVLELSQVGAGYRDILGRLGLPVPHSGSCNNDVACPEGAPWRDEIRSAVQYSINGSLTCSGTLIADVPRTFRPFVLTANHCGLSAANAATVVTYWKYQASTCGGPRDGAANAVTQSGAALLARWRPTDMALLELAAPPVAGSDAYWAGWDRRSVPPASSVSIHHPSNDEKAITFDSDPMTIGENCIENPGRYPDTHWYIGAYEDGTTEPGSSGSGIWDEASQLLVGTLSGGAASCFFLAYDCWGRLGLHWDSGASAGERLRDWLDPAGTNALTAPSGQPGGSANIVLDGFDILDACALGAGNGNGVAEPGESITILPRLRSSGGTFTVVRGTLDTSSGAVSLVDPSATWADLPSGTPVTSDAPHLRVLVAESAACGSRVDFTLRVQAAEGGPFDLPLSLDIGEATPQPDTPLAIPDLGTATSTMNVAQDVLLTSLAVRVSIAHTHVGDLRIRLVSPSGLSGTLLDRPGVPATTTGCADDDLDITFIDSSAFVLESHCAGTTPWHEGEARAVAVLGGFAGESTRGDWLLVVEDRAADDTGTILDWELITVPPLQGRCSACSSCTGQRIADTPPDVIRVRKGSGSQVVLTFPGAASACATGVQVRMSPSVRPASGMGSFPVDPPFADVTSQDSDPGPEFAHSPGAGTRYYLVVEDLAGAPGPSGSYGW